MPQLIMLAFQILSQVTVLKASYGRNAIVGFSFFVSAREWWKFAFTCIIEPIKERTMHRTWSFAVKRARDVVKYVNLYSQHLISGSVEPSLKVHVHFIRKLF